MDPADDTSVDRMRDLIVRSELWMSSPADFNDPFDTSTHVVIHGTDAEKLAMLERMGVGVTNMTDAQKVDRRMSILADTTSFEAAVRVALRKNLDQLGVVCFTPRPRNLLMWGHYAASHTGLVFQFEPTQHLDIFTYPVPVKYEKTYPVLNWVRDHAHGVGSVMLRKHPAWEHEHEYRIVHPGGARSYLPFAPAGLTGIIIGCKATNAMISKLQELLSDREKAGLPHIRLFRAHKHPLDYRLVFRRMLSVL